MKNFLVRITLAFLFLGPVPALAQSGSRVVAVCGTLPAPYAAGSTQPPTIDVNGTVCSNSSGGGGGAVTIADGADVTQGAIADAASTAGGAGTLSAKLRLMTTQLGTLNTTLGSPFQAGGSIANTAFGISGTLPAFAATPTFNIGTVPTIAVTGTFFQATQPVSGAVTNSVLDVSVALSGMTANNAATQITLQGTNSVSVLLSGTWVGTLTPQVSADGGTTWVNTLFFNPASQTFTTTVTTTGTFDILGTGGKSHARVLLSPYTSGTVTGNLRAVSQSPSEISALYGLALQTGTAGAPAAAVVTTQGPASGGSFPTAATPIAATSGNVAAATATATLAAAASKTTYISGFQIAGSGATVGTVVNCTVTNITGSVTLNYPYAAVAGALLMNTPIIVQFNPPLSASAQNTAISVSCPSLGTGNTNNTVNAMGYQQ